MTCVGDAAELPSGFVTFLLTDIEGSTRLFRELGNRYPGVLDQHRRLLRSAAEAQGGVEVKSDGDSLLFAFGDAAATLRAAADGQEALRAAAWPVGAPVAVRMGVHTGEARPTAGDYVSLAVHQVARVAASAHGGQIVVSTAAARRSAGRLPKGSTLMTLGPHQLRDFPEPVVLHQLNRPGWTDRFPPLRAFGVVPHNLPFARTTFVGRADEMASIRGQLASTGLVTVVGVGGVGKTRVALEVASSLMADHDDGVWLIELAQVRQPDLVPTAVTLALRVDPDKDRSPTERLVDHLRSLRLLLVLDNCEHVIEAAAELVATLTRACPRLTVLATSRQPLDVDGEALVRLAPLPLPGADDPVTCESVRLFAERATLANPQFMLDENTLDDVSYLVTVLDGIPLAIELAAARCDQHSPAEIARRMDDRFALLTRGHRTSPRHRTLEAALEWSFELLSPEEQAAFRRLAVLAGVFDVDTAACIVADTTEWWPLPTEELLWEPAPAGGGTGVTAEQAPGLLESLASKSLLERVAPVVDGGPTRYVLLETMREYAGDKLLSSGEDEGWRHRQAGVVIAFLTKYNHGVRTAAQAEWMQRAQTWLPDIGQALAWSLADPSRSVVTMIVAYFAGDVWRMLALVAEGIAPLTRALDVVQDWDPRYEAGVMGVLGALYFRQGDLERAVASLDQQAELSRRAGWDYGICASMTARASVKATMGQLADAAADLDAAMALVRRVDPSQLSNTLSIRGTLALALGDFDGARERLTEALALARQDGNKMIVVVALNNLAVVAQNQGRLDESRVLLDESILVRDELGDREGIGTAQINLANLALLQGDLASALSLSRQAVLVFHAVSHVLREETALRGMGEVLVARGELISAATILGAAESIREETGSVMEPYAIATHQPFVDRIHAGLTADELAEAWARGRQMSRDKVVTFALSVSGGEPP